MVILGGWKMGQNNPEILQGTLDMLLLKALQLGPLHGYAIARRVQQFSDNVLKVEEGSLYPALHRKGRKQLELETAEWKRIAAAISRVMESA
jgi:DNA-binding PadR family transcriptional regulator